MAEYYLDVTKSVIISSPAGSGKTEKLARRYISLLSEDSKVEKILCITFTEKAAAEMKERILSILKREDPELHQTIRPKIPLMRISTIHSFCLKVLKRFAMELGIDPSLEVMDGLSARSLWTEAVLESLMAERERPGAFLDMIKKRGLKGWNVIKRQLEELHSMTPYPEMALKEGVMDDKSRELMDVYRECLMRYKRKKLEKRLLDFSDLEMLAYAALSLGPEAHNILYSFDEHTDHLLVDEFQDTSTLQWNIIEMLTEEWRSGMGAKREAGKTPTIFLVGDEKQSIYLFRGANVGIFEEAKRSFAEWLGEEYHFIQAKDNYRSLPTIVDFTNRLFEKLMPPMLVESWMTRYSPFEAARKEGKGRVELLLLEAGESTRDTRAKEAETLARRIKSLHGRHEVFENGVKRPCEFGDMAVLLRRRTHLGLFEDSLRKEGVPFIVLKGIGFYEEPETALLREFVSFTVDPSDDYSLFCLLRSPLFSLDYGTLERLASRKVPLLEKLKKSKSKRLSGIYETIEGWLSLRSGAPLAELLEKVFQDTGGWAHFREKQRHANIKKFIAIVEGFEAQGFSPMEIREKLLRQRHAREEAKANINAEGMDAVKVMTIHAAKGLQFPMVYLPSLDEKSAPRSGPVVIDDTQNRLAIAHEEDPKQRNRDERFRRQKLKELEEEKRLFYVAVTRAMDYLCMIGSHREGKLSGRLDYLGDAFDLFGSETDAPLNILKEKDIMSRRDKARITLEKPEPFMRPPVFTEPLLYKPSREWKDVTEVENDTVRIRHGENWVLTGTVMHRLLEELSTGALKERDIEERAVLLLRSETPEPDAIAKLILKDFGKLRESGLMEEIVLPRENSHAELPFVLEKGEKTYRGRIDRLIIKNDAAFVYDYKTFPVQDGELAGLKESYGFQMSTYAEAAERLFGLKTGAYLVFTHLPKVVEVK